MLALMIPSGGLMQFNTVILYDIENLIGGYSKLNYLTDLSLKDIYNEINKKIDDGKKVSIQKAYANWADPRLKKIQGDIVQLGIEPIQLYGFGKGQSKNASDIQLVIDAMEIAFTKKHVDTFIIVSGDGGFSALAKKLHEYGLVVIGCAYHTTINKIFKISCDDFIWIEEPKDEFNVYSENVSITNPIVKKYSQHHPPCEVIGRDDCIQKAKDILSFFVDNSDTKALLSGQGLNVSILSETLNYGIRDFNFKIWGFASFIDFIKSIVADSGCKLSLKAPSDYRLFFEDCTPNYAFT